MIQSYKNDDQPHLRTNIKNHFTMKLIDLRKLVIRYISQLPVIGFNSGKYDIYLIRQHLLLTLFEISGDEDVSCIKRNNTYLMLSSPNFKFLDISNYLAPGFSYSQFLKAYGCNIKKGFFPYEWFDSYEKL